jgi:hypothetical protein
VYSKLEQLEKNGKGTEAEESRTLSLETIMPKLLEVKSILESYLPPSKLSVFNSLLSDIISWATHVDNRSAKLAHIEHELWN